MGMYENRSRAAGFDVWHDKILTKMLFIDDRILSIRDVLQSLKKHGVRLVDPIIIESIESLSIAVANQIHDLKVERDQLNQPIPSAILLIYLDVRAASPILLDSADDGKNNLREMGGKKNRKKSKLDKHYKAIQKLLDNGATKKFIANRYNTTEANFYNWFKSRGLTRSIHD
jgi:hypothetical protein